MTFDRPSQTGAIPGGESLPLALLGHDLRAALAEMRSSLQLLQGLDVPEALRARIGHCRSVGENLARLIDQSVLVCLGQASSDVVGPAFVNTVDFLAAQRLRWTDRCAQTGHRFQLTVAGQLPDQFRADRTALERVLANLVSNAISHTPSGTITMTFKISDGDLLLAVVEDEGLGFSAAQLAALQNGFALPAESLRPGGGLGLQSVRRLVEAMGGRCNARNKTSGGAAVSVCLPIVAEAAAVDGSNAMPPPLEALPDLTGIRLMVADDCASSRGLVELLGRQIGASVQSFEDGHAVIAALQQGALPDAIVLDVEMPGATGLEVLRWLRGQSGALGRLPVLALTSHVGQDKVASLRAAGATDVMTKPLLCRLELGRAVLRVRGIASTPTPASANPDAPEVLALDRLRQIAGPEAAVELFLRIEEDLSIARAGLARAVSSRDLEAVRAHSHVVIALAGTVGAGQLHADAVTLNTMAHDRTPPERVFALAEQLDAAMARLQETVRRTAAPRSSARPDAEGQG